MVYRVTKRIFDILFSIISIILFIPFWIIIPTLIKIDSPGGVIFKQKRIGINSRYFTIYKFRTMKKGTADIPTDRLKNQSSLNLITCLQSSEPIDPPAPVIRIDLPSS